MCEWSNCVNNLIESMKPTDSESVPKVVNTQCTDLHVHVKGL